MSTTRKSRSKRVRIGRNLTFTLAELEAMAAQHDADYAAGEAPKRMTIGKVHDLINRYPSSADVPDHLAVPVSKHDRARLARLARQSGQAVEALVAGWVRDQLARVSRP